MDPNEQGNKQPHFDTNDGTEITESSQVDKEIGSLLHINLTDGDELTSPPESPVNIGDEDANEPELEPEILIIFAGGVKGEKADCLKCGHLVSHAKKTYPCHYDDGNENCPAPFYRIVVGVNIDKASTAMAQALADGDLEKIDKINKRLKDKDEIIITEVLRVAKRKWAEM